MARVITLVLEAATYAGSVAVLDDGRLVVERSVTMRGREREALMPAVAEALDEYGVPAEQLGRIVCGAGPGSFTSLRIAAAITKGLALASGGPLVPVSSLALLVASQRVIAPGKYLAAIDALRGEHYVALYEVGIDGVIVPRGEPSLVATTSLGDEALHREARLIGGGMIPADAVEAVPHARGAAQLISLIDETPAADLAAWEPSYGRLAEAQVKWEAAHGRPLAAR
jgi:tRNA threonylcarbamoyladenosine biosynthesis protein TsaB